MGFGDVSVEYTSAQAAADKASAKKTAKTVMKGSSYEPSSSVDDSAAGVALRTNGDRPGAEGSGTPQPANTTPTLFGRGDQVGWKNGNAPKGPGANFVPFKDGTHIPGLDPQLASLFGKGNVTGGAPGNDFNGNPTMYPAQMSVGQDIFGDTADLFKQRDTLRAQRDAFFAKNPLSATDIGGNFAKVASMAGNRRDLEELNKTLQKREEIMGNLAGHMMGAQATTGAAGIRADADVKSAEIMANAPGRSGKTEDPLKGPAGVFDSMMRVMSNPEAFAALPPDMQDQFKQMAPAFMNHFSSGYGIGLRGKAQTNGEDERLF